MKKEIYDPAYKGEVVKLDPKKYVSDTDFVVEVIDRQMEKSKANVKGASIIVAGGYGMGSKENFDMLFDLAATLGAEVGASRAAVDAGYIEHERQIGQTGVTVRPKLYIAAVSLDRYNTSPVCKTAPSSSLSTAILTHLSIR